MYNDEIPGQMSHAIFDTDGPAVCGFTCACTAPYCRNPVAIERSRQTYSNGNENIDRQDTHRRQFSANM
jgi:hypothetical protein